MPGLHASKHWRSCFLVLCLARVAEGVSAQRVPEKEPHGWFLALAPSGTQEPRAASAVLWEAAPWAWHVDVREDGWEAGGIQHSFGAPDGGHTQQTLSFWQSIVDIGSSSKFSTFMTFAFYALCFGYLLLLAMILLYLNYQHREIMNQAADDIEVHDIGFSMYLKYRFTYWFVWNENAKGMVLVSLAILFVMVFSTIYYLLAGSSLGQAIFVIFTQLVEPDGGKTVATYEGQAVCAVASIGGLIIFALLIALTQERFNLFLEQLREGKEPVVEAGHYVMVGWTDESVPLICELCEAYRRKGGCKIAILSEIDKPIVEQRLREVKHVLGPSVVIVRDGRMHSQEALALVGAHMCSKIIIMSDKQVELEARDASAMRILLTLRSNGWPYKGRILVHCACLKNRELLEHLGGKMTSVVTVEDFVGRILVQGSTNVGITTVMKQTFGFGGAEFYMVSTPECVYGKSFHEALGYFPDAVFAGVIRNGRFRWYKDCIDSCYKLQAEDEIMLFAHDDLGLVPSASGKFYDQVIVGSTRMSMPSPTSDRVTCKLQTDSTMLEKIRAKREAEIVLILGWNRAIWHIIAELDASVGTGTKVISYSQVPADERREYLQSQQKYHERLLVNISSPEGQGSVCPLVFDEGLMGSRFHLEEMIKKHAMPLKKIGRIIVLSDEAACPENSVEPDSGVISTILHVRMILHDIVEHVPFVRPSLSETKSSSLRRIEKQRRTVSEIPIIAETRDPDTEAHCRSIDVVDFVDSAVISAQVLAMVAYEPRLSEMLFELVSEYGKMAFEIRDLADYLEEGMYEDEISFLDATRLALAHGDLLLGWSSMLFGQLAQPARGGSFEEAIGELASPGTEFDQSMHLGHDQLMWEMNPVDKATPRPWHCGSGGDRLAVLCDRSRSAFFAESPSRD